MGAVLFPLQTGVDAIVRRYAHFGPFLAALLANFFATFGDKGQLVVITLASKYDAKKVFVGAMTAFAAWSAVEVVLGSWITRTLPPGVMSGVTGTLFVLFGLWTAYQVYQDLERGAVTDGGVDAAGRTLPDRIASVTHGHGPYVTAFLFIAFAEFGDKTQLLTINLAATFPGSPYSIFAGVVVALGLRTGLDAFLGEQAEQHLPTLFIEAASALVFVAFGLFEFGLIGSLALIATVVAAVFFCVGAAAHRYLQ